MGNNHTSPWSDDIKAEALALAMSGSHPSEVKELLGPSVQAVRNWYREHFDSPVPLPPTERSERKARALKLYADGMSSYEVSEIVGVDATLIWRWAQKAGINRSQSEVSHKRRLPKAVILMKALQIAVQYIEQCPCDSESAAGCTFGTEECHKAQVNHFIAKVSK